MLMGSSVSLSVRAQCYSVHVLASADVHELSVPGALQFWGSFEMSTRGQWVPLAVLQSAGSSSSSPAVGAVP